MKHLMRLASFMALVLFMSSCNLETEKIPVVMKIESNWEFKQADKDDWMPAIVPGTVHTDLMANGVIDDPHYALNEKDVQWIEKEDWIYKTVFEVGADLLSKSEVELQFKGLDTYADVYLNGNLILQADNMFIEHRAKVKQLLIEGDNELKIYFHSPVKEGMKKLQQLDYLIPAINEQAPVNERTNIFTRKAPFHYGWDWGPRLVTSGVWRPVILKAWDNAIVEDVYLETRKANEQLAEIFSQVEITVNKSGKYKLSLYINGNSSGISKVAELNEGTNFIDLPFEIKNPRLWWTNGLGEAYQYQLSFRLEQNNVINDDYELLYGVRTLRLVQEPDEVGRSFYFELNGVPVFMKGANIIPSETLTPVISKETYQNMVQNAIDGNMNMLRAWGGAIYPEDYLYQLCNENGILIWQDFMFACNLQPGDEPHLENIKKEAEYNVKRLRNNASMALWCGNNENLHGWHHWGWKEMYTPEIRDYMWRTYERIFYEILPTAVQKFDSKTSYWSTSPSSYKDQLADRKSGDEHDWTIWFGQKPFSAYGENVPRFVSEYGLQAFPGMHTISSFSSPEDYFIDSEVMRQRQRSKMEYIKPGFDGNDMIKWYMAMYYRVPDAFEDFVYVSQLLQAHAYKTGIEAHRRAMPYCMGSLYWQLNDSWPTISWASVDYYGRWKASHYAVREANKEVIVSPVVTNGVFEVYAVSDRLTPFDAQLLVTVMDFYGNKGFTKELSVNVAANTSSKILSEEIAKMITTEDMPNLVVSVQLKEGDFVTAQNLFYFKEPKDLKLPVASVKYEISKTDKGYNLVIESDVLIRHLFIDTPYGDAFVTDNFFDVLPQQKESVEILTNQTLTKDDIKLVSLNDLHNK